MFVQEVLEGPLGQVEQVQRGRVPALVAQHQRLVVSWQDDQGQDPLRVGGGAQGAKRRSLGFPEHQGQLQAVPGFPEQDGAVPARGDPVEVAWIAFLEHGSAGFHVDQVEVHPAAGRAHTGQPTVAEAGNALEQACVYFGQVGWREFQAVRAIDVDGVEAAVVVGLGIQRIDQPVLADPADRVRDDVHMLDVGDLARHAFALGPLLHEHVQAPRRRPLGRSQAGHPVLVR